MTEKYTFHFLCLLLFLVEENQPQAFKNNVFCWKGDGFLIFHQVLLLLSRFRLWGHRELDTTEAT